MLIALLGPKNMQQRYGDLFSAQRPRLVLSKKVTQHRRFTGLPKFHIFFKDTTETYTNLDLDYVLKYSTELPLKYHTLKAQWIVDKAREAGIPQIIPSSADSDAHLEEKVQEPSSQETSGKTSSSVICN
jgi:hypothetical protein